MGIDCEILFQSNNPSTEFYFSGSFPVSQVDDIDREECPGATHIIHSYERYFGPYYTRGRWQVILEVLGELVNHSDVGKVWYGGDNGMSKQEVTTELIVELTMLYLSRKKTL